MNEASVLATKTAWVVGVSFFLICLASGAYARHLNQTAFKEGATITRAAVWGKTVVSALCVFVLATIAGTVASSLPHWLFDAPRGDPLSLKSGVWAVLFFVFVLKHPKRAAPESKGRKLNIPGQAKDWAWVVGLAVAAVVVWGVVFNLRDSGPPKRPTIVQQIRAANPAVARYTDEEIMDWYLRRLNARIGDLEYSQQQ